MAADQRVDAPNPSFQTRRRVEFCETDAAGIAHFASFLCFMEQAEHQLLRSCGMSVLQPLGPAVASELAERDRGWHLSWPRVHVECDYTGAARFEDELDIEVSVLRLGSKSVTYGFHFSLNGNAIATGKIVAVCCRVKPGEPLESCAIPTELVGKLGRFLATSDAG